MDLIVDILLSKIALYNLTSNNLEEKHYQIDEFFSYYSLSQNIKLLFNLTAKCVSIALRAIFEISKYISFIKHIKKWFEN